MQRETKVLEPYSNSSGTATPSRGWWLPVFHLLQVGFMHLLKSTEVNTLNEYTLT